jgi:hypothetical protein
LGASTTDETFCPMILKSGVLTAVGVHATPRGRSLKPAPNGSCAHPGHPPQNLGSKCDVWFGFDGPLPFFLACAYCRVLIKLKAYGGFSKAKWSAEGF